MSQHEIPAMERETDPLDISARRTEAFIADKIAEASRHQGPKPTGFCLDPGCGEQLVSDAEIKAAKKRGFFPEGTLRWCSPECRDAWEKDRQALDRRGRSS